MLTHLLAHSGETHETAAEAVSHQLPWLFQVLLFVFGVICVFAVSWLASGKRKDRALLITATILLIVGIGLYAVAPIISILSITFGLFATLFATLVNLSK